MSVNVKRGGGSAASSKTVDEMEVWTLCGRYCCGRGGGGGADAYEAAVGVVGESGRGGVADDNGKDMVLE